jgi:two-component sensor histidine kinase
MCVMDSSSAILIIDDNVDFCLNLEHFLVQQEYSVLSVFAADTALEALRNQQYDVALLDIRLADREGTDLLPALLQLQPDLRVIIMTGYASLETAIRAIQRGAYDYFEKPLDLNKLVISVQNAIDEVCLVRQEKQLLVRLQQELLQRKQAEQRMEAALAEKEVLLKEIHHRVKNNLLIVSSLLALSARIVKDPQAQRLFWESQTRAHAMARVHQHLYRSGDLARVAMPEYLRELVDYIRESFSARQVQVILDVADVVLTVNDAIPCGLITNELVCNALEHGFTGDTMAPCANHVRVAFQPAGNQLELSVSDNGVGLPSGWKLEENQTLGLELIRVLVDQLGGSWSLESEPDHGTTVCVRFSPRAD